MKMKKTFAALLCVVTVIAMLLSFAGCGSTPKVAITVDGKAYTTGEYLAYMLENFNQVYYNGGLYYYAQNGMDIWSQEMTYNEETLKLEEYIKKMTVDAVIRQKAVENKIAEEKVTYPEDLTQNAQSRLNGVDEKTLLNFGVSKESYTNMCMAYYRDELALFLSRYDKDGSSPIAEEEIRKYFDENYLSYKIISVQMTDSDGKELSADEQENTKKELQKYLDMYTGGKDFNEVIAQYNYDTSTADNKELEKLTDKDTRKDMDAKKSGDEDLAAAIQKIPEGSAEIVTYSAGGTTLTAALILRLDPEKGEGRDTYFADNRRNLLLAIQFDDFDKEIDEYAKTLSYYLNKRAYKMCTPKEFV